MSVAMTETKVHVGDETISESKEANDAFAVPGAVHGGDATGSSPTTATTGRQVTAASPRGLCCKRWCNKGAVSNYITACFMVLGIALCAAFPTSVPCRYVLSFGLFGFAGGVTNWLAILMLFDRVPFLIGSGVIPRRFKEIRATVKETIMDTFFDKEYLEAYLQERAKGVMSSLDLGGRIKKALEADDVDALMVQKLEETAATPEGMMLQMASTMIPNGYLGMVGFIKPALVSFSGDMAARMETSFDLNEMIKVDRIREEIDQLMTEKLKLLTAPMVKKLLEEVIRTHLGWLIVWGNVFGGIIGLISQAAGFGMN